MKVKIVINNFDHDAMVEDRDGEVATILRNLADRLDNKNGLVNNFEGLMLLDSNGNRVGEVVVDWD